MAIIRVIDTRERNGVLDFKLYVDTNNIPSDIYARLLKILQAFPTLNEHYCIESDALHLLDKKNPSVCLKDSLESQSTIDGDEFASLQKQFNVQQFDPAHLFEHLIIDMLANRYFAEHGVHASFAGYSLWLDRKNKIMRVSISCNDVQKCRNASVEALKIVNTTLR